MENLPVAVLGAGPVGLAAAAHLAARKQKFILLEMGEDVGNNIRTWEHVRLFSPWKYNVDKVAKSLLESAGWIAPNEDELPTGSDLYNKYLKPLSLLQEIDSNLYLNRKVVSVGRKNFDKVKTKDRDSVPFVIEVENEDKSREHHEVRAVIDTTGTWNSPNPLGSGGNYAIGEKENHKKIFYGIPDVKGSLKEKYKNKNVVVVGGGHSAMNVILDLGDLKKEYPETKIHWVSRKAEIESSLGGKEKDGLPARGLLGIRIETMLNHGEVLSHSPFLIHGVFPEKGKLFLIGFQNGQEIVLSEIDEIIAATGSRPDFSFLREIRLDLDIAVESAEKIGILIDPNIHSCGTVRPHGANELAHPEKNFYIAGSKSYGRAPTFLLATGYEQVRSIVAALVGDREAANRVELDLPETGVCSTDRSSAAAACCNVS
ncbi:NAD(P)-binding domain-containing protein [Leptospira sp. 201903071]|uniref:NAD(P)-binding domain-containing protein n=1 Tax=Leptospira ainazelensis TaxID=2810034 RepID=UPI0019659FC2|nr:NAD(P)-binding domain-containing protein [Leptospira ainazelensis]MBM9500911.1 NAD(P)-binding domain-containing protein [Leptospira ainazelensis]